MGSGEMINIHGPLGTGFPLMETGETVLLVGGGVGIPPLHELGVRLREKGVRVVTVLGFRDGRSVFCLEDFKRLGDLHVATEDGSAGTKGYVTDVIEQNHIEFDVIYACGPKAMLKSLDLKYQDAKKGYLSFEERMACGIGACYGCMAETKEGLKRVCKDGPVFRLGEIVYE
jgi:dihydroorotate dehydrogenase electron transfer subunit